MTFTSVGIIIVTFILVPFLNLPCFAEKEVTFIESDFLHKVIFPFINLSGMTGRNPISQEVVENWKYKLQVEGVGIAAALIHYLKSIDALKETGTRILIVGSPAGNTLGLLSAALILAKLNITCDFYIVKQETKSGNGLDAFPHAKKIIEYIINNPVALEGKLNILNESEDPMKESVEIDKDVVEKAKQKLIKEITTKGNQSDSKIRQAAADLVTVMGPDRFTESDVEKTIKADIIKLVYAIVVDGICGNSMKAEIKFNVLPAIRILNTAECAQTNDKKPNNLVVSNDMPSLSDRDGNFTLPTAYNFLSTALPSNLAVKPIIPKVILNMGAPKLHFLKSNEATRYEKMTHYVIIPWALQNALREDGPVFLYNFGRLMYRNKFQKVKSNMTLYKIVVPELDSSRNQTYLEFAKHYYASLPTPTIN